MAKTDRPELQSKTALISVPADVHQWLLSVGAAQEQSLRTMYQLTLRFAMDHDKQFRDYVAYHMKGVSK